jgi:hypothetical protein
VQHFVDVHDPYELFHETLDEFMIIYVDDILVYSKIIEEHVEHLEYVLNKLHETNSLPTERKMNLPRRKWTSWDISCHKKG